MSDNQKVTLVSKDSLPVSCPPKGAPAWNMHPRVYIELKKSGEESCPYCGATYRLEETQSA